MLFEFAVVAGILFGLYYALLGVGLNLVFGVLRVVNLAHGDLVMLGSYLAFEVYFGMHESPLLAIAIGLAPAVILGGMVYAGVRPRLARAGDPEMLSLVLFFGVSQVIEALASIGFGSNQRSIPAPSLGGAPFRFLGQSYPRAWWVVGAVSACVLVALLAYLYATPLGRATRAVKSSAVESASVGIDVRRISTITFGVGTFLAVSAGVLGTFLLGGMNPTEGVSITIIAFAVIVLGGLGNSLGTVAGGIIFGLASQLTQTYASTWSGLVPYALLLVVMLARPSGLLSRSTRVA
ncbi:MAG: branched-chain amino acid ABC transporter permease [Streptosporangiaceae bacterium]